VIGPGEHLPPATVWVDPGGASLTLAELAAEGPLLLFFYLFDWTPT
jgi:hypothetical protein